MTDVIATIDTTDSINLDITAPTYMLGVLDSTSSTVSITQTPMTVIVDSYTVVVALNNQIINATVVSGDVSPSVYSLATGPSGPQGPMGPQGIPGTTDLLFSSLASTSMIQGTPVYISPANSQLYPADNSTPVSSRVVGLLIDSVTAGFIGTYNKLNLTLADWSAITNSILLLPGQYYFLGSNGKLTTIRPESGTCTVIGSALNTQTLALNSFILPILL